MDFETVLKDMMLTPAPSGYEGQMAYKMKSYLGGYCDETYLDRNGNCIGLIQASTGAAAGDASGTSGAAILNDAAVSSGAAVLSDAAVSSDGAVSSGAAITRRVMIFAHMDQIGFIVRRVERDGFLRVERLGGIPEKVLPGAAVSVRGEDGKWRNGVFGVKSHHAEAAEDKYKVAPITEMYVDVGARNVEEARGMGIHAGCPAVYAPSFTRLSGDFVSGTSVDDRGGCAALVAIAELLKRDRPKCDVYLVGTVWEEFNLRGAALAARAINPDIAISLDVTLSGDTHDLSGRYDTALGGGACVQLYSFHGRGTLNGTLPHEPLFKLVKSAAEKHAIPFQRFASAGLLTDMAYLQLEGGGVACLEMGFPARYTHSPVEVCDIRDIDSLSRLCAAAVADIDINFQLERY